MTQTPKVEKLVIHLAGEDIYYKEEHVPVNTVYESFVSEDYVTALETALKASKEYNKWLVDYSGNEPNAHERMVGRMLLKEYQDALAKVDVK